MLGALNSVLARTRSGAGVPAELAVGAVVGLLTASLLPSWLLDATRWGWLHAATAVCAGSGSALHLRHLQRRR